MEGSCVILDGKFASVREWVVGEEGEKGRG